ncbi:MAG: helix-turn-helix domain-containing protein [Alphaproteobacteria bacterium]|nr:helix-turn-helix domain-containing protein [Alphaproteobacteria bacterium]
MTKPPVMLPDVLLEGLSENPTIASVTAIIGEELMGQLSADLGGMSITLSRDPGPANPVAASIGLDAARKIGQVYAGMNFEIPLRAGVKALIMALLNEGTAVNQIARRLRVSRRMIYKVMKGYKDPNQFDLF